MNTNQKTRNLTFLGVMLAVTIIMDSVPLLGAIPMGSVSATITHIPTIITGIILGPIYGLVMGTSFGIVSLIHAATRPVSPIDPLFMNPLLSVLPRMLIGVASYYGYTLARKILSLFAVKGSLSTTVSSVIGGILGSLTNTVFVLGMLYLIYAKEVAEKIFGDAGMLKEVRVMLLGVVVSNALLEAIVAAIITSAIVVAYKKVINKEMK